MTFTEPHWAVAGSTDPTAPLVVLLHGRGQTEQDIISLAAHLPPAAHCLALRAPIPEGEGFAWFANRGVGRPIAESLAATMAWFHRWLASVAAGRPVFLVGFSGGAAFAGGLALDQPERFSGVAVLYGTLPFDAGVPVTANRLAGLPVFVAQGDRDRVIPAELLERTWAYLHTESSAPVTSRRDPGGHRISADTAAELKDWLLGLPALASHGSGKPHPVGLGGITAHLAEP